MRAEFISAQFLTPRHWPIWCLIGLQRLIVLLPWRVQRRIGGALGWIAARLATKRREIARHNLALAFPEQPPADRQQLLAAHFRDLGVGLIEIGMAWWASDRRIARLCDVEGLEHLPSRQTPAATFLVAGHFTTVDMIGRGLNLYADFAALHRPLGIALLDAFTRHGRRRSVTHLIDKGAPRELLESLRANRTIWIAVDQADTTRSGIEAPFFGVPAATNTTVSRLAGRYGAQVLPISCIRQSNGRFLIRIEPALADFGDQPLRDATALNATIERHIGYAPSQYYWIHRRFKRIAEHAGNG